MKYNIANLTCEWPRTQNWPFSTRFSRVSSYLGQLITTNTWLRLYTSAEYGSRVVVHAPALPKRAQREPCLVDIARKCTRLATTIVLLVKLAPWLQLVENHTDYSIRQPHGITLSCKHTVGLSSL